LEALRQEHIEVHKRPVIISGYSEGAGIAISLAGEIDKQQRATSTIEGDNLPKNMLRLWSLTGVVDIDPKARGVTVPFDFLKEVSKIGLIEIIQRYTNVTGEKVVISNKKELFKFLGKFSTFMANPKNWRVIREQLAQSAEENLGMLNGVFGKIMTAKSIYDVLTQLKKIETRNPICDQLGKNWSVVMVVPRNDLLFPWRKVKATLRKLEESRGEVVEVLSPNAPNPARARRITDIAPKLFPNAGKVTLRVVGDRRNSFGEGGMQLGQTHVGPENDPEKYLPDDPLT